jgi:hypothetical protein
MTALTVLACAAVVCSSVARAEELKCAGVITKIEGQIVTVKTVDAQHELTALPSTKITLDNKPGQLSELKVGYKVRCLSDKEEKKILLRSLDAVTTPEK